MGRKKEPTFDFAEMMTHLDLMREILTAQVAAFTQDGFSEAQARTIVSGMFNPRPESED